LHDGHKKEVLRAEEVGFEEERPQERWQEEIRLAPQVSAFCRTKEAGEILAGFFASRCRATPRSP
jgi:hypothetical protein